MQTIKFILLAAYHYKSHLMQTDPHHIVLHCAQLPVMFYTKLDAECDQQVMVVSDC